MDGRWVQPTRPLARGLYGQMGFVSDGPDDGGGGTRSQHPRSASPIAIGSLNSSLSPIRSPNGEAPLASLGGAARRGLGAYIPRAPESSGWWAVLIHGACRRASVAPLHATLEVLRLLGTRRPRAALLRQPPVWGLSGAVAVYGRVGGIGRWREEIVRRGSRSAASHRPAQASQKRGYSSRQAARTAAGSTLRPPNRSAA